MKRRITFLLAALLLMSGLTWAQSTLNIESYALANNWSNGTQYLTATVDDVTFTATGGGNTGKYYTNGQNWRFYQNESATLTISVPDGSSLSTITPTYSVTNNGALLYGSEVVSSGDAISVSGTSVTFSVGNTGSATNGQVRFTEIEVTYTTGGTPAPSISANNIEIAYDATEGAIAYTINDGVDGGVLTAATEAEWLTIGTIGETVPFTCTANEAAAAREGVVTLTYTYGDSETVTKDVTVTQEGAPVAYTTIPELFAAATSTGTDVLVNFNSWVVSGVSTNGKNVFVTDNEGNGFVIYDNNAGLGDIYAVNDILSGEISCTLKLYNGFAELLNVNAEDLTITEGGIITEVSIEMANLSGVNTGALLHYDNLTCSVSSNKYYLTDGTTTLQVYNSLYTFEALTDGNIYNITGIYQQYNSTKEILPRSAEDIEEVVSTEPSITLNTSISVPAEGGLAIIPVEYVNIDDTQYPELRYFDENLEPVEPSYYEEWITLNFDNDDNVQYNCDANTNVETRSIYFKVLAHDYDNNEVTSNLVTLTQEAYVAPASITLDTYSVEATAAETNILIPVTYQNIETSAGVEIHWFEATGAPLQNGYEWITAIFDANNDVYIVINANNGETRTAYFKVYGLDAYANGVYSDLVTITQDAPVAPVAEGWVLTNLADLTSNDVFVIVGTDFYGDLFAMSNDNGTASAPAAVSVTVVDDMLSEEPADNIQWNLSIADNGYTFYPNGNTESWLYCTTTSGSGNNNNMRVGDGSRNVFTFNNDGYMITNDDYATRYMSVYNNQEWRGYVNTNNNPVAISFYKKVGDEPQPVVASITVNPALVEATAAETEGTLTVTYVNIADVEDEIYFCDANGEAATYDWITADYDTDNNVYYFIEANTGEARTAYFMVHGVDADANDVYSNLVTINQDAYVAPAETWVLTNLADLTEGDVFVIVGTRYDDNYAGNYAMPNDNDNSAPGAVAITINGEALAEEPAANLQWNISRTGNSYTFYPNGDTENWLYCTNANNGVKVGVGSAHHFTLSDNGYLTTTETTVQRYLGIYNSQDWRCYTSEGGNIANQTFAFYKKNVSTQTYNLTINGYGQSEGGYRLIASPVYVNPENTGMITDDGTDPENYTYDFYFFDQAQEDEWRNYRQEAFNLIPGKGYLYAHNTDVELTFTGIPYSGDGTITLVKDDNAVWAGWNLVGNPFGTTAYLDRDFYVMNEAGTEILTDACTGAVEAMQGVFVIAGENGETLTFTNQTPEPTANVTLNLSQNRGAVIDRAIVRFGEGRQLPKFQLNAESTKLYIPQGNNDYAVVSSATQGEMPMNFKAQSNGSYTISVNTENAETNYLHLIDNMTGADIDLLRTPSYTFEAKTTDYASRFRLVFNVTGIEENTTSTEPFAFFNGSEWVINNTGEATLQMVDLTGRILSSESISGNATVSTANLSTGIYMMRLVNSENVKTQKVVIK